MGELGLDEQRARDSLLGAGLAMCRRAGVVVAGAAGVKTVGGRSYRPAASSGVKC